MDIKKQAEKYISKHIKDVYNEHFCVHLAEQKGLTPVQTYIAQRVLSKHSPRLRKTPVDLLIRVRNESDCADDYNANLDTLAYKYAILNNR